MNVSKEADAAFMAALKDEQPERYERLLKNIRRDNPSGSLSEEQALTNYMLGFPTTGYRFEVIAGHPAPEPLTQNTKPSVIVIDQVRESGRPRKHRSDAEKQRAYRQALRNPPVAA